MVEHIKEVLIKSRSKKDLLFAKDNLTEEEKIIYKINLIKETDENRAI